LQEGVADGADIAQPELLHEPALQSQDGVLNASLGGRRVRANDVDVERAERAAECVYPSPAFASFAFTRNTERLSL